MKQYTLSSGQVLTVGAPFEADGIAHAANWADVWSGDDFARFGVTVHDLPDPPAPPAPFPRIISDRQFFQQLAIAGLITQDEALAAVGPGTIPATLAQLVNGLPATLQFEARMLLTGATQFDRKHPMVNALMMSFGWSDAQTDDLWRAAAAL